MAVPKKRTSHGRRNMRRSHHHIDRLFSVVCPNCAEPTLRHHICPSCGQYRGKQVIALKENEAPTPTASA